MFCMHKFLNKVLRGMVTYVVTMNARFQRHDFLLTVLLYDVPTNFIQAASCQMCFMQNVLSVSEFERHAACKTNHPNNSFCGP